MAYEDDWIKNRIFRLEGAIELETVTGVGSDILKALLSRIINLEQEVKELRSGGKRK